MGKSSNTWPEDPTEYLIHTMYRLLLVVFSVLTLYLFYSYHHTIILNTHHLGYETLKCIDSQKVEDENAPLGYVMEYTYVLPEISGNYRTMVFYSSYHDVWVELDGEVVYGLMGPHQDSLISSSGHAWNYVVFENDDSEKTVLVREIPDYEGIATSPDEIMFGEVNKIDSFYIYQDMGSLILSIVAILIGLFFLGNCFVNWKNAELDKNIVMLGTFAILVGAWKLTDTRALSILFPNMPVLYVIPFFSLSLAPFAFVGYSRYLFQRKDDFIWRMIEIVSIISSVTILLLQVLGRAEFRQSLFLTHITIGFAVVFFIYEIILEAKNFGIHKELKVNLFFILLCLAGVVFDLVAYYVTDGNSHRMVSGILCFVIYVSAMGWLSVSKAKCLMIDGARAKEFERLAYRDPLTDIQNRMAFNQFVQQHNFVLDRLAVAMFDLNDLKKCNDSLGHEMGDMYIKTVASILDEKFRGIGNTYRMGGDEFCVLVPNATEEKMDELLEKVEDELVIRNEEYPEIAMEIASGYAIYEPKYDASLADVSRRADALMYAKKFKLKHKGE